MCKRKPGRRCPTCQRRALTAKTNQLARAVDRLNNCPDTSRRRKALEDAAHELARDVACRRADLYSTREYQESATAELRELLAADPKAPRARQLAKTLFEGQLLDRHRRHQEQCMPPAPHHPAALAEFHKLGDARFEMAHCQTRMDLASGPTAHSQWSAWQQRHLAAAQHAALAHARMTAIAAADSETGWNNLTDAQKSQLRADVSNDGTFDTPLVPQAAADIADETQDILDGETPLRTPVDAVAVPPFTATPRTRGQVDTPDSADSTTRTPRSSPPVDPPRPTRVAAADSPQMRTQQRRRARRRRGAMSQWRSIRSRSRRAANQVDRSTEDIADGMVTSDMKDSGAVFDLTFLSMLIEQGVKK